MKRVAFSLLTLTLTMALATSASAAASCSGISVAVIEQHGNIVFDPSTCSISGQGSLTLAIGRDGATNVHIHNSAGTAGAILTQAGRLWAGRSTTADQVLATLNLPAVITLNGAIGVHFFAFIGVPVIAPTQGVTGSQFTITDPLARMRPGDLVIFRAPATLSGTEAVVVSVSENGTSLVATVPVVDPDITYQLSVQESIGADPRFDALFFRVVAF